MADVLIYDLYSGPGGVGHSIEEIASEHWRPQGHTVEHVGIDIEDYGDSYPGEFIQADASAPPLSEGADLVWASPPCQAYSRLSYVHYENPREHNPTFDDLDVHEIVQSLGESYIIENVALCEDLDEPARINGFGVGLPFGLERWFETPYPVPDRLATGVPETGIFTKGSGDFRSKKRLAEAKGVPETWSEQAIRSAIPREYVQYLLHYCPAVPDVPLPQGVQRQALLSEVST